MTTYVSLAPILVGPYAGFHHMWGDTPDETLGLAYAVGAQHQLDTVNRSLGAYLVSGSQTALAMTLGARDTDKFGPRRWFRFGMRGAEVQGHPADRYRA